MKKLYLSWDLTLLSKRRVIGFHRHVITTMLYISLSSGEFLSAAGGFFARWFNGRE